MRINFTLSIDAAGTTTYGVSFPNDGEVYVLLGTLPRRRENRAFAQQCVSGTGGIVQFPHVLIRQGSWLREVISGWNWGPRRRGRTYTYHYWYVDAIMDDYIDISPTDYRSVVNALRSHTQQQQIAITLHPPDLQRHYCDYFQADDDAIEQRVATLAQAIGWLDQAVRQTTVSGLLPADAQDRWEKIKKMRTRAAHETTPLPEKETCLRVTIRFMEKIVDPTLLVQPFEAAEAAYQLAPVTAPMPPTARVAPRRTAYTTTAAPADNDFEALGRQIQQLFGADCSMKVVATRVTLFWRGAKVIVLIGGSNTLRLYSRHLGDFAQGTNSKGNAFRKFSPFSMNDPVAVEQVMQMAAHVKAQADAS